jgi:hypothetical protein
VDSPTYCPNLDTIAEVLNQGSMARITPTLLVVPGYIPGQLATTIREQLDKLTNNINSSIYTTTAPPLYEYREESGRPIQEYLDRAETSWRAHAQALDKCGNPISAFIDGMMQALNVPVKRLEFDGRACFFGQYRCFGSTEDILPHVDALEREFPSSIIPPPQQWAVNIMLRAPKSGGELEIWDIRPTAQEDIGYGFTRPFAAPSIRYKPSTGDLYLFQSGCLHAISRSSEPRCALAGFIAGPWADGFRVWS